MFTFGSPLPHSVTVNTGVLGVPRHVASVFISTRTRKPEWVIRTQITRHMEGHFIILMLKPARPDDDTVADHLLELLKEVAALSSDDPDYPQLNGREHLHLEVREKQAADNRSTGHRVWVLPMHSLRLSPARIAGLLLTNQDKLPWLQEAYSTSLGHRENPDSVYLHADPDITKELIRREVTKLINASPQVPLRLRSPD